MEDDASLVHRTLAGDREAFSHLVERYWKSVYAQTLSIVRNPADAEELTNDVFIEAYLDLPRLRRFSSFQSWLNGIAKHRCLDWLRRRPDPCMSLDEVSDKTEAGLPQNSAENQLLQQEKLHKTLEAIKTLPEMDRSLMQDFYLEGDPYKTLQGRYNLSKAAVKMRLFRARQKVRARVKELFSGVAAFQWRNSAKNLLMRGGLEVVKIGMATRIAIAGTVVVLMSGGISTMVWRSHQQNPRMDLATNERAGNELDRAAERSRNFGRDVSQSNAKDDKFWDVLTDDNASESVAKDALEEKSNILAHEPEANDTASQESEEDEEFWEWYQQMYQDEVERYTSKIDESLERVDPLFEEIKFYKVQVEPFRLQEDWARASQARAKWRSLEREVVGIYVFLREEELKSELGHLYLSTPEYARVEAFAEHWYATHPRNYNIPRR